MSNPSQNYARSATRHVAVGLLLALALVAGFGGWAALARIDGAVVASGQVEVEQNRQVVQHPNGGVVSEILVSEGDTVALGDVILRLDGTLLVSQRAILADQLSEESFGFLPVVENRHEGGGLDPVLQDRSQRHGVRRGSVAQHHSRSPIRNSAALSSRMCGGPSPGRRVSGAGAKRITL